MRKSIKIVIIIIAVIFALFLIAFIPIAALTPHSDKIKLSNPAESYFIENPSYIDYQSANDCSAYATAYVMRCLGTDISGEELYPQMKRVFGIMTARSIIKTAGKYGHSAKAYHGNIDALKARLQLGRPIICLITNDNDTHYVVAVGYDTEYIYLVDSIQENTNIADSDIYNRKIKISDFQNLWKNDFYAVNNVYIVME